MRTDTLIYFIISVASLVVGAFAFMFAWLLEGVGLGLTLLLVSSIPCVLFVRYERTSNERQRKVFERFVQESGGADHLSFENRSGIAVSAQRRLLMVFDDKKMKSYKTDQVRSWSTSYEHPLLATGAGVQGLFPKLLTIDEAGRSTGLFLQVRDIETPVWQIRFSRKLDRARWSEILDQLMNDRPSSG